MDEGKLFIVRGVGGGFIAQALYGEITWGNAATDSEIRRGRGGTYHIFGVLPHDYEVG